MGDDVTCEVCGRPQKQVWMGPHDGATCARALVVNHPAGAAAACYRLGYEREKARADAAEANDKLHIERAAEAYIKIHEALAAARRECDLWKQIAGDLYAPLEERDMHMCSASGPGDVHANVCGTFGATNCPVCLVAALAATAASVECPECNQPAPIDADGKIGPHRLGGAPCANGWPDRKEKSNG